jgi:hypothetical protein
LTRKIAFAQQRKRGDCKHGKLRFLFRIILVAGF